MTTWLIINIILLIIGAGCIGVMYKWFNKDDSGIPLIVIGVIFILISGVSEAVRLLWEHVA